MSRYVVQAYRPLFVETPLWDEQREGLRPEIFVDGEKTVNTGLVTTRGEVIMRVAPPIGFGRE